MRFVKASMFVAAAALLFTLTAAPRQAQAESKYFYKTYKVQVQYWFFDTDYYYWSTVYESSSLQEATMVYELLEIAQENHQLNDVVGSSYSRYIAMDVRMITQYHYPSFEYEPLSPNLNNYGNLQLK